MGNKTIKIDDNISILLREVQIQLEKVGIEKTLVQIHRVAIIEGITKTFDVIKEGELNET